MEFRLETKNRHDSTKVSLPIFYVIQFQVPDYGENIRILPIVSHQQNPQANSSKCTEALFSGPRPNTYFTSNYIHLSIYLYPKYI